MSIKIYRFTIKNYFTAIKNLRGIRQEKTQPPAGILQIDHKPYGTVVRAHDIRIDNGVPKAVFQRL